MSERHCRHVTLARGAVVTIHYCPDCRAVSLNMGAMTVRLQPAAAEALWVTLGDALHELRDIVDHEVVDHERSRAPIGTA